jgi:hypothetical protein
MCGVCGAYTLPHSLTHSRIHTSAYLYVHIHKSACINIHCTQICTTHTYNLHAFVSLFVLSKTMKK